MGAFLSVRALHDEGLSNKAIARRLQVDVRTVRKYVRRCREGATAPERARGTMKMDRFEALLEDKVRAGLSATQIHADLTAMSGFDASYETVARKVRTLRTVEPQVYCRMRFAPGEEGQIDFGEIGRIPDGDGTRKLYLFVMTLCYSRMAYYELVRDQKVPTFLGAIRRAFEFFGGAPARVKPDNLKSAVLIDQLGQRYYQEDFFRFCRHYGTVPDAARVATPTDKGRTERDIGYAKGSAFRGRTFRSVDEAVRHLTHWRDHVANVRVHGTTRRRPVELFADEQPRLRALPDDRYEIAEWGLYKVRKDCHVHVFGNYYSVPYLHVGTRVLVRLTEERVTAFGDGAVLAEHPRAHGKGQDVTNREHYPETKRVSSQEIHRRRLLEVRTAGPHAARLVHELRQGAWVFGDQLNQLSKLLERHGPEALDRGCERALFFGATQGTGSLRRILDQGLHRLPLPYEPQHAWTPGRDFERPLAEYDALLDERVEVGV